MTFNLRHFKPAAKNFGLEETRKLANEEGVALNQLINVAVAEKLSALKTEEYLPR